MKISNTEIIIIVTPPSVCVCLNAYIILLSDFRASLQKTPLTPDVVINYGKFLVQTFSNVRCSNNWVILLIIAKWGNNDTKLNVKSVLEYS